MVRDYRVYIGYTAIIRIIILLLCITAPPGLGNGPFHELYYELKRYL